VAATSLRGRLFGDVELSSPTTVRIGGAGVAGLTAAINLARAGEDAEVLEMKAAVGSSAGTHTEGVRNYLGRDGLEDLARFGVRAKAFSVAQRVFRRSPNFTSVIRGPSYYLIARGPGRGTLERQLLEQALDAGARVVFRTKVLPDAVDILATGAARARVNIVAAGYRFTREGSNLRDDEIHSLFDNAIAPHGYLCVLPGPVWHSVYTCAWSSMPYNALLRMVDRALAYDWVRDLMGTAEVVGRIFGKAHYASDPYEAARSPGPLRVGEAAGIQDAAGGFGIRYAIASGALAARSFLDHSDYAASLRAEFQDDFEIANRGRAWLARATNDDYDAFLQKLGPEGRVADYAEWRKDRFAYP